MNARLFRLIALVAALVLVHGAQAQMRMDPQRMAERQTQLISEHITGLSDSQKIQVAAIDTKFAQAMQSAFQSAQGDRSAMRQAMQGAMQDREKSFQQIFSTEQLAQYRQLMDSLRQARMNRMGSGQ
jgi:hypothetical protein